MLLLDPPLLSPAARFPFGKWKPGKWIVCSATQEALPGDVRRRTDREGVFPEVAMDQAQKRLRVVVAILMDVHAALSSFLCSCH